MPKPQYGPKCPNHLVSLVDLPFPLTKKGTGVCPISTVKFDYEIELDEDEMIVDKNGNPSKKKKFTVTGDDK